MGRLASQLWWVVPPVAVALVLGVTVGYPVAWLAYVAFNVAGVWLYCDRFGSQRAGRQHWLKVATILMLPAGIPALFGSGGRSAGPTPSPSSAAHSNDPGVRKAGQHSTGGSIGLPPWN